MSGPKAPFDLSRVRQRLAANRGGVWAGIEELMDEVEFEQWIKSEFPAAASLLEEPRRREFLKLMGASLMMAGLSGCNEERADFAMPYVLQPENETAGVPRYFATAICFEGYAQPVIARVHAGRPIKLDGNPEHPATRGGSDVFMQMAVLQLYDPDRSKIPYQRNIPAPWNAVEQELTIRITESRARQGEGLRILIGDVTSPTIIGQLRALQASLPNMRIHRYEPIGTQRWSEASQLTLGRDTQFHTSLETCNVIVSVDDDFLGPGPRQVLHAEAWSTRRGEIAPGHGRSRLHMAECVPTPTGAVATSRIPVDASRLSLIATTLAARLGMPQESAQQLSAPEHEWVIRAADDLSENAGRSLLTFGAHLPPQLQGLAIVLNERLGNIGKTIRYSEPILLSDASLQSISKLAADLDANIVETLIVLDCNPAYSAPAALKMTERISRVPHTIHAGLYRDETALACQWHVPLSHTLESWGDVRAIDGTATIVQPVIAPLYDTRTVPQILAMLLGNLDQPAKAPVTDTWRAIFANDFETRWRQSLHDGFVADSAPPAIDQRAKIPELLQPITAADETVDIVFKPDTTVWDGRFANVAWLQEIPKPLSKLTWDNVIAVSPRLANNLKLANGDLVKVSVTNRQVTGPAWIVPGQAPNTIALYLGYGRRTAGRIGSNIGYSANEVRPVEDLWHAEGSIRKLEDRRDLASMQLHHRIDGYDMVREVTTNKPNVAAPERQTSIYPPWPNGKYAWGMVIDLDRCIGCNACIAACNVENNVQVVGKDQVAIGREMLWLRVDHYYAGDVENPRSFFQPVPCMHCEIAPCEMGCPVNATVHSPEGVNEQVYNRCIGTRTCSSYCPYKVRRFNWYDYRRLDESSKAAYNPDVTVRSRGVMEKCTYCTQRIEAAHAEATKESRAIRDSEVVTACQQACPAKAITFGNINDPESAVSKLRGSGRHYSLLEHLGTRPRTTYLARWNDAPDSKKEK